MKSCLKFEGLNEINRGQVFLVKHYLLVIYLNFCFLKFRILCKKTNRYLSPHARPEEKEKNQPKTQQPTNMTTSIMLLLYQTAHISAFLQLMTQKMTNLFLMWFYISFGFQINKPSYWNTDIRLFLLPFNLVIWWLSLK